MCTAHAFDRLALGVGAIFASFAALTLLNDLHQDKIMNLERALESSREIGTAIRILTGRERCTADQAFDLLRTASQHAQRDIAAPGQDRRQAQRAAPQLSLQRRHGPAR